MAGPAKTKKPSPAVERRARQTESLAIARKVGPVNTTVEHLGAARHPLARPAWASTTILVIWIIVQNYNQIGLSVVLQR